MLLLSFFFNDTATTEIYTLSLHDALPICLRVDLRAEQDDVGGQVQPQQQDDDAGQRAVGLVVAAEVVDVEAERQDRKSTLLNSSHANISYAVFCLKKKK